MAKEKKRGPKGGIQHQPGRGHDSKSTPQQKKRFRRKAERKRRAKHEAAKKQWEVWDGLSDEQVLLRDTARGLLGKECPPSLVRAHIDDPSAAEAALAVWGL